MQLDRFEELCSAYVLDALDTAERQEFEAALESATDEQLELFGHLSTTGAFLGAAYEPITPAVEVKSKLMSKIERPHIAEKVILPVQKEAGLFWRLFTKAMVPVALVVVIGFQYRAYREQQATLEESVAVLNLLKSPDLEVVQMAGLGVSPNSIGKVFWDRKTGKAVVQFIDLPTPPAGKDYQLWVISGDTPKSAGVFSFSDDKGSVYFQADTLAEKDPAQIQAFAVTLEPKGGVAAPTGDMYLKGAI